MRESIEGLYGSMVFGDAAMRERLPGETYAALQKTMVGGRSLDPAVADVVAAAMKDWAIEKGATHYTHWFHPMTGVTAEKHDSFITPDAGGRAIMDFSGKQLIKGESDASSFPSGGLRATFEARGYTAWDPTTYAFIKDDTLCIPTAFCSWSGDALDYKTPLLRSLEALNRQVKRILKLFGHPDEGMTHVTVGAEQEYFLIDKDVFVRRKDLVFTGRTLFGARPPKGQELDDHYFGAIKPRVISFMKELDQELWKLGIPAKTEHNEAAPSQHELAPVFTPANQAADYNQLTMELMKKIAGRHGMVCLLHEKPFAGVNGSGKHNNWSITTSSGVNLFEPGDTPYQNAQFLLFLCAVIQAADEYQDLLRVSVASAGNDHRLGTHEAPPAVISLFLGDELTEILAALENESNYGGREKEQMKIGVHTMPRIPRDTTDRNRTSPLAFTGNKFEFRMVGSSMSVASPNIALNTAVAEVLRQFADALEPAEDFQTSLTALIRTTIRRHKRIIFNGNGYGAQWLKQAEQRGLLNLRTTPDALETFILPKNIELFSAHRVYTPAEVYARYEIMLENYNKALAIESLTMLDMASKDILPACLSYMKELCEAAAAKQAVLPHLKMVAEEILITKLSGYSEKMIQDIYDLEVAVQGVRPIVDQAQLAAYYRDTVIPAMQSLRTSADAIESVTAARFWPFPSYSDLLFSV